MKKKKKLTRSEIMARVGAEDTSIELILRKELWKRGVRSYRKNYDKAFGKPDIAFPGFKLAVFCDGEFWHGKKLLEGEIPETNRSFWIDKLQKNVDRDKRVNETLKRQGWTVLRFWQRDILKNPETCADEIEKRLR